MPALRKNLLRPACAGLFLLCIRTHAQLPAPPATTEDALRQMLAQSGAVFTGQVAAVRHLAAITEVDFAIDDAILGVAPNTIYTLREWTGILSTPNSAPQFEIAHRYLIFLHAPGPGGLSSPVGGPDGAIPILPGNQAASPTTPDTLGLAAQSAPGDTAINNTPNLSPSRARTTFRLGVSNETPVGLPATAAIPSASSPLASSTLTSAVIDLRWIAAGVLAPLAYMQNSTAPAEDHPAIARADAATPSLSDLATPAISQLPASSARYSSVVTLLRAWREEDHASR